ncbi:MULTISPECIES: Na(+)/H(+) antiporter subunit F1 [Lysinibacillus]|jgi:multicomponent Na+:H+ antiporter subunit F|uniref:Na(+)/H(+) antiporter subunit F1 n=2 Tax=Lysinibacillus TaxID=400634 RepID=A0A544UDQ8_LYSSH|nr:MULTISPECIES: Na(+)/H(+) antiporter subunit F1 [Lysinibacillus]KMY33413.1 monovalent cation/H+ antiporter subunit F [Lysinibacillus xylanilyticus]MCY9548006.1 Na(+)/H(+) antiporter subunit F1 [Lysinibacillus xylanilyticus]MDD1504185.1 Na(+)/H(+) antiporter subunit F1 [Lysinibacillus sp. CNPSo 3705]MEB2281585.1 Na(+)/H(+) antiporter subunit F1 [Lysinibacillus xylanilyticus]MED3802014.1 Na(+)/H(+) antiporter subunit F1 [Lysinibacillus xylanilyticus]
MTEKILLLALALFSVSIALSLFRVIRGPSLPDRAIALDTIGVNLLSAIAIVSIILKTKAYLEAILILGILAFIGTIAFTKYIERGVIVERKSND